MTCLSQTSTDSAGLFVNAETEVQRPVDGVKASAGSRYDDERSSGSWIRNSDERTTCRAMRIGSAQSSAARRCETWCSA